MKVRGFAYVLLALGIGWALITVLYLDEFTYRNLVKEFYVNFSSSAISIAVTVLIIDRMYEQRNEERDKRRIIAQMGSPSSDFALEAVRLADNQGWLQDGSLKGAKLRRANLGRAMLISADLSETNLNEANLSGANLSMADLRGANLSFATLHETGLMKANLRGANLAAADLTRAVLFDADLRGAILSYTDLRGADLGEAILKEVRYDRGTKWPNDFVPPPDAINLDEQSD